MTAVDLSLQLFKTRSEAIAWFAAEGTRAPNLEELPLHASTNGGPVELTSPGGELGRVGIDGDLLDSSPYRSPDLVRCSHFSFRVKSEAR